MKKTWREWQQ